VCVCVCDGAYYKAQGVGLTIIRRTCAVSGGEPFTDTRAWPKCYVPMYAPRRKYNRIL